jgi:predicted dehydrogenase
MTTATRIAVAGAGLIGRRHIRAIDDADGVALAAVVEPDADAVASLPLSSAPLYGTIDELIAADVADGVVLAIPNALHAEAAHRCVAAGLPVLVEKPLTTTVAEGEGLVAAAAAAGVPLLTGHHRRYNDLVAKAHHLIESGQLGHLTLLQAQCWLLKPDRYFDVSWRREVGAGPVLINLIHDVDLMQFLCGPVVVVQAMSSNAFRLLPVEDTAVVLLRFASGLLGTMSVTDAAAAPWSWELTARENAHYAPTPENAYLIGGTRGSLALPGLALWSHGHDDGWWGPISKQYLPYSFEDPLVRQMAHFGAVIRGEEQPICSGEDGLAALRVIEAIRQAAASGAVVEIVGDG